MPERFFEPFQRSHCLFSPDLWCEVFNHRSPNGTVEFLCEIVPQTMVAVLPAPANGQREHWNQVYGAIASVWGDRRLGFQCFRVGASAFGEDRPCGDCDMVRKAQVVVIDLDRGRERLASFRDMAISSLQGAEVLQKSPGLEVPTKKVVLINCGDPGLPPHVWRSFDVIDYANDQGDSDLSKLVAAMREVAFSAEIFREQNAMTIRPEDIPDVSESGAQPAIKKDGDLIRILEPASEGASASATPGPGTKAPEDLLREIAYKLKEVGIDSDAELKGPWEAVKKAQGLIAVKHYDQAVEALFQAGELEDPEWERYKKALIADCLEQMAPREIVDFFFAATIPKARERLTIGHWEDGRPASTVLTITDSKLREWLLASQVPLYLFGTLKAHHIQELYDLLITDPEGDRAAFLVVAESDEVPVGIALGTCRDQRPAVHFIELRLSELRRAVIERANGANLIQDRVQEHYGRATDFYLRNINKVVSKEGEFFGRHDLINRLIGHFDAGDSFAITGLRRAGKTSLLRRLERVNNLDDHLLVLVNLQRAPPKNLAELYHSIADLVRRALENKYALERYPRERFEALDLSRLEFFSLSAGAPESAFRLRFVPDLEDLLKGLRATPDLQFRKLILLFDEIEDILPDPKAQRLGLADYRDFLGQLRDLNSLEGFMMSMVSFGPLLARELSDYRGPLFSQLQPLPLGMLTCEECEEMVWTIGRRMYLFYEEESHTAIYRLSGGDPQWAKLLCSDILTERSSRFGMVKPEEVEQGLARLLRNPERRARLEKMLYTFEEYFPEETTVLKRVALGAEVGERVTREWLTEHLDIDAIDLPSLIDNLRHYALLDESHEGLTLSLGLMHHWLRQSEEERV